MIFSVNDTAVAEHISAVRAMLGGAVRRAHVITFGCQQNEADGERILGLLSAMGYQPCDAPELADIIVVNTCAIREHAEMKALSMLGRFKALKKNKPDLIVGVVGCMAAEPHRVEQLKQDFHFVTFTLEPNMLHRIPELIRRRLEDGKRSFVIGADTGDIAEGIPTVRRERHRAWVSVMYGCNNFCSYCIVPYVRGRERSRDSADVLRECRELVDSGVKEITLLGQNVNSYRSDISFAQLVRRIAEIEGDFIIRFMTSHPKDTSDELISVMGKYGEKVAPYFHLPLQSGSNGILRAMNRTYDREKYLSIVDKLRESVPGIAISTDIIVGFPGESEADFEDTMDILRRVRFDMVYAFIYSPREGTRAARFDAQIPKDVKSERLARILALQDGISLEKNLPYEGTVQKVLVDSEESRDGATVFTGRTPTNKLVHFTGDCRIGESVSVFIEKACPFDLLGRLC